jgi:hypothetical protein
MMTTTAAAAIDSYEASTLPVDGGRQLACLYVIVDGRTDPRIATFLAGWGGCCTTCDLDWQSVRKPRSALVGIDLVHTCDDPAVAGDHLRLVFDVRRDADALAQLAATEVLVVATRPYGAFANVLGACPVDGRIVRDAVVAAGRSLDHQHAVVGE